MDGRWWIRIVLALALVCTPLLGQEGTNPITCWVQPEHRMPNRTGSQCVWSSIETLGNYLGIEQLRGLTRRRECQTVSSPGQTGSMLSRLGVRYKQTQAGQKAAGMQLIEEAMQQRRGAMIGIRGMHAICLIHWDGYWAVIVDNVGSRTHQVKDRSWLERNFDGWALVLLDGEPP